jgi:pimeloyl-ACP methyl ester carboxylesterase
LLNNGRVKVGNGSLYYEEAGTGAPVIFVHGHSLDHRMWDEQFSVTGKKISV